jgi:ABC-type spermidine/putrescine transport system permease subunit II
MKPETSLERALAYLGSIAVRFWMALCFGFLLLPLVIVAIMSFTNQLYLSFPPSAWSSRWYLDVWNTPRWWRAMANSVQIGAPVALLSMVLGTLIALSAARSSIKWTRVVAVLAIAPMMLPHVIIAIGLYPTMLDLGLASSYSAVIIGHTVIATPLVVTTVSASLRSYDHALELAAMTLGADAWRVFWRVTFPMVRAGIAVGGIFAFAVSFDELMLALFLTSPRTETVPRLLWEHLAQTVTPSIAAVATIILAITLSLFAAIMLLRRGRAEAGLVPGL